MYVYVLAGFCYNLPVAIAIDLSRRTSIVSTRPAVAHNLPRLLVGQPPCIQTSAEVRLPSPSGWYSFVLRVTVEYVPEHDVLFGTDWGLPVPYDAQAHCCFDPSGPLPDGIDWTPSSSLGTFASFDCLQRCCSFPSEVQGGFMSSVTLGPVGPLSNAVDDQHVISSSSGQGSSLLMAGGRVAPPNVMYAVRTLFPFNVDVAIFGPHTSEAERAAYCCALRRAWC